MNIGLRWIEFFGFTELCQRFGQLVFQFESEPEVIVQRSILRRVFKGGLKFSNRRLEVCFLKVGGSEIGAVAGVIGTQTQRGFELRNRLRGLSALDQRETEIVMDVWIVGLQLCHAPEC